MPDIDILIKATNRASGPLKDVAGDVDKLGNKAGSVAGKGIAQLQNALGVGLKVAAGAAIVAIGALGVALGKSFSAAINMEQAVADIMAVMGKAAPPVEELNRVIQDLGLDPKLKVSAFEAADAIEMLAKNGITWEETANGMARSTILLANATNDDFALAADVATDAMVQFNKDASDMADVVDGIIGVTQQSKFDINDYALALSQAGGVAGSVGVDFDDFNAMLAATSSSFASGSDAGTSFKVFLQQLIPDTNKSADAMRELGLFSGLTGSEFDKLSGKIHDTEQDIAALDPTSKTYSERLSELNIKLAEQRSELMAGGSAFFDANGNMKSGEEIAGALAEAFTGLSDAERISAASTIFGTDAMRTALALADAGGDTIAEFKQKIGDTSAEDAAATRMDTLSGKWAIFTGVVETNAIKIGSAFLPAARNVTDWATELATTQGPKVTEWFDKLGESTNEFITKLREGKDPLTAFRESFQDMIPAATLKAFDDFKAALDFVKERFGPLGTTIKNFGVDALKEIGLWVTGSDTKFTALNTIVEGVHTTFSELWKDFSLKFPETATVVDDAWIKVSDATKIAWEYVTEKSAGLVDAITEFGTDSLAEIVEWAKGNKTEFTATKKIWEEFSEMVGIVATDIHNGFFAPDAPGGKLVKWFKVTLPESTEASVTAFTLLSEAFALFRSDSKEDLDATQSNFGNFTTQLSKILDSGFGLMMTRASTFLADLMLIFAAADAATEGDWDRMWKALGTIQKNADKLILEEAEFHTQLFETIMGTGGENAAKGFGEGVDRGNHFAVGAVRGMGDAVKKDIEDNLQLHSPSGVFRNYGLNTVQGFIDGASNMLGALGTKIGELVSIITSPFSGSVDWLRQKGVDAVQGLINGIGGMIGAAQAKVTELANLASQALATTLESDSPSRRFHRYGAWAGQGFVDGIGSKLNQARQVAMQLAQTASTAVQQTVQSVTQPAAKVTQSYAQQSTALYQAQSATSSLQANVPALTKYLAAIREDGDWMNDWLTHMSTDMREPLKKYFGAIKEDGDYLNDWLTHLPTAFRGVVRTVGEEMANTFKSSVQSALGIHSPSSGLNVGMSSVNAAPTTVNSNNRSNQMIVQVQSSGDAIRDIRNQVELYALTFGAS